MTKLVWDASGTRTYETGVDHGVLYLDDDKKGRYGKAIAWNGLTTVTQSPSGAEPSPLYADNIKYLNLTSAEEFAATIEAYTYPDEFAACDGSYVVPTAGKLSNTFSGITIGQQARKQFGFAYRTIKGNDEKTNDYGYKLHLVYGATAAPSERAHATVNDSPEAITFSWSVSTTPVAIQGHDDLKPTALVELDSTALPKKFMDAVEAKLFGDKENDGKLLLPHEIIALYKSTVGGSGSSGNSGSRGGTSDNNPSGGTS